MAIPLALIVGLIAVLAFANTKNRQGERTLTPPPDEPEPATPRTLANHAPTTPAPRSRPVVVKLEISIGLSVSSFEKLFMSTDDLEEKLVKFTTASTRRLNRLTWATRGHFVHPRVSYSDKDYGFRITVSLEYTAAITRTEMTHFQQLVSTFIAENDQLRPRLLSVHARKV